METSEVLVALENLKEELEGIKSAKEQVERAVVAAGNVSRGFDICGNRLQNVGEKMQSLVTAIAGSQSKFDEDCIEPLRVKVRELVESGNDLKKVSGEIEESFAKRCEAISQQFQTNIGETCKNLNLRIDEFHKELDAFGKMVTRMAERIESQFSENSEKLLRLDNFVRGEFSQTVDSSIDSAKKDIKGAINSLSGNVTGGFEQTLTVVQATGESVSKAVKENLSNEVVTRLDVLKKLLVASTILLITILGVLGYIAFKV